MALRAFENVQNITGSTIKTSEPKNQHKPFCKFEFPFPLLLWLLLLFAVVDITCIEYFLSIFLSSLVKIFEILWKWFEFIHYSFLVSNTCVSTLPLYAHVVAIKNGCLLHICI